MSPLCSQHHAALRCGVTERPPPAVLGDSGSDDRPCPSARRPPRPPHCSPDRREAAASGATEAEAQAGGPGVGKGRRRRSFRHRRACRPAACRRPAAHRLRGTARRRSDAGGLGFRKGPPETPSRPGDSVRDPSGTAFTKRRLCSSASSAQGARRRARAARPAARGRTGWPWGRLRPTALQLAPCRGIGGVGPPDRTRASGSPASGFPGPVPCGPCRLGPVRSERRDVLGGPAEGATPSAAPPDPPEPVGAPGGTDGGRSTVRRCLNLEPSGNRTAPRQPRAPCLQQGDVVGRRPHPAGAQGNMESQRADTFLGQRRCCSRPADAPVPGLRSGRPLASRSLYSASLSSASPRSRMDTLGRVQHQTSRPRGPDP